MTGSLGGGGRWAAVLGGAIAVLSPFDIARPPDGWSELHLRPLLLVTAALALAMIGAIGAIGATGAAGAADAAGGAGATGAAGAVDRRLGLAIVILVAGFALASLASPDRATGLAVTVRVAVLGLVFVASATVFVDPAARRHLVLGVAVGAGLAGLIGLGVLVAGSDRWGTDVFVGSISVSQGVDRLTRPFSHANVAAMYLAPAAVLLAGAVGTPVGPATRLGRAVLAAVATLAAVALSLTLSRGGLVALVVGATALTVVRWRRRAEAGPVGLWLPPVTALVAIGVGVGSGRWEARLSGASIAGSSAPVAPSRREIWSQAIEAWLEQPLTGVGPGRFGIFSRSVTPVAEAAAAHAHNPILEVAATGGLVALFGLVVFAAVIIGRAVVVWSTVPVGLSAALAAAMLPMVTDNPFLFSSSGNLAALIGGAWYGAGRVPER